MHNEDVVPGSSGIRRRGETLEGVYAELREVSGGTFELRSYLTNVLQTRKVVPGASRPQRGPATAIGYVMYLPGLEVGKRVMFAECVVVETREGMLGLTFVLQHALITAHQWELRRLSSGVTTPIKPTVVPAA